MMLCWIYDHPMPLMEYEVHILVVKVSGDGNSQLDSF